MSWDLVIRGVECIDLAARVPRDAVHFWDDAHFSEAGAGVVAEVVVRHLLATRPLAGMRRSAVASGDRSGVD